MLRSFCTINLLSSLEILVIAEVYIFGLFWLGLQPFSIVNLLNSFICAGFVEEFLSELDL